MELHQWLDKPENEGKATWLAGQLDRSKTAVSLWREQGVPLPLIPRIAELTGGAVTTEAMLQHAMRCKAAPKPAQPEAAPQGV
jgi:hypothetical protein